MGDSKATELGKDMEIARLKGQIEAYENQYRAMSIELLRLQVSNLLEADDAREKAVKANQFAFGRFQVEVNERLAKASAAFVELREMVRELRSNGEKAE